MTTKTKILLLLIAIITVIVIIILILFYPFSDENSPLSDEISEIKKSCIDLGCPENALYAGSINSDKFYYCTCSFAKNINPENLVCFQDEASALADNRTRSDC